MKTTKRALLLAGYLLIIVILSTAVSLKIVAMIPRTQMSKPFIDTIGESGQLEVATASSKNGHWVIELPAVKSTNEIADWKIKLTPPEGVQAGYKVKVIFIDEDKSDSTN